MKGEIYNVGLSDTNISKKELCERIQEYVEGFILILLGGHGQRFLCQRLMRGINRFDCVWSVKGAICVIQPNS